MCPDKLVSPKYLKETANFRVTKTFNGVGVTAVFLNG